MSFTGQQLIVDEVYQRCAEGDRCIVVDTHCGFCCEYTAINGRYEQDYNAAFDKSCRRFAGTYCSCFDLSAYPSCVNGKCQLVEWPAQGATNAPPATPPRDLPWQHEPAEPEPAPQVQTPPPTQPQPQAQPQPQPQPRPQPQPNWQQPASPPPALDAPINEVPLDAPLEDPFGDTPRRPNEDDSLYAPLPESLPPDGKVYNPLEHTNDPW